MLSQYVCPSIRLSVCPSVTRQYSSETAKDIIKLFSAVAGIHPSKYGNIPTGPTPIMGASNATGYEKIAIFDQYLVLSPKLWNFKLEP